MAATYKTVKLFKLDVLGIGSYGKVCNAKCDDLPCAAKLLHETLFDPNTQRELNESEKRPIRKFEQEREFMQELRHPNIVQCLGVYYEDPSTGLPALLMELMDDNLTTFLKNATQPIRYDIQVNICHDISLALSYLHSNGIIHRDLSSNNILLIGNVRAKVADLGMAKLSDLNPQGSRITRSRYPGTDVYMPPECCKMKPMYSEKVDCFSFGVLVVQILTRKEPDPGEKLKEVPIDHPSFPSGFVETTTPEVERRQDHISEITEQHPLRPMALKCLENESTKRPSAQELCEDLAELKKRKEYHNNRTVHENSTAQQNGTLLVDRESTACVSTCEIGINTEKDELVAPLEEQLKFQQQRLAERDEMISHCNALVEEKDEKFKETVGKKDDKIRELEQRIESQQEVIQQQRRQLKEVRSSSGEKDQLVAERERRITEINQQLSACTAEKDSLEKRVYELGQYWEHKNLILRWKKDIRKAPRAMYRSNDAVVDDSKAYFRPARTREVYSYDETQGWSKLPDCPYESSPLVIINNRLTAVGGCRNGSQCTDKLCSLQIEAGNKRRWIEELPHMPTKRSHTSTLCTGAYLIVAGGKEDGGVVLRTVEVLCIEDRQWYRAADLPEPCWCSSMTVLDGYLFVMGGVNGSGNQTNLVHACSLESFLQSLQNSLMSPEAQNGHSPERTSPSHTSPERRQLTSSGELNNTPPPMRQNGASIVEPYQNGDSSSPERQNGTTASATQPLWIGLADLPVTQSTCVQFRGRLLAISGKSLNDPKPVSEIYVYLAMTNTWEVIGHIPIGRFTCFAAVLSHDQLMVVGGYTDNKTAHDSVEFAS
jgi:serine/threonine protein kinase